MIEAFLMTPDAFGFFGLAVVMSCIGYTLVRYGKRNPLRNNMILITVLAVYHLLDNAASRSVDYSEYLQILLSSLLNVNSSLALIAVARVFYVFPSELQWQRVPVERYTRYALTVIILISLTSFTAFRTIPYENSLYHWLSYSFIICQVVWIYVVSRRQKAQAQSKTSDSVDFVQRPSLAKYYVFLTRLVAMTLGLLMVVMILRPLGYVVDTWIEQAEIVLWYGLVVGGATLILNYLDELIRFLSVVLIYTVIMLAVVFTVISYLIEQLVGDPAVVHQLLLALGLTFIVTTLFLMLIVPRFVKRILLAPFDPLMIGIQAVEQGDSDVQIPIFHEDEVGYMSRAFNRMARSVNQTQAELEDRVTERTAQLAAAKESAESANRAKTAFLATMSHELRTPLNAVIGYADLLQKSSPTDHRPRHIYRSGQHLLTLIEDVLNVAKIETGRVTLQSAPTNLRRLIDDLAAMMRQRIEENGVQFTVSLADDLPHSVEVDERRLRQILINLLGNAAKFTDAGTIALSVSSQATNDHDAQITFAVQDSGVGIPKAELTTILQPFYQSADGQQRGGTGLGLAISQELLSLMESRLNIESTIGVGTRMSFTLSMPAHYETVTQTTIARQIIGIRGAAPTVLIVDDHASNRALLRDLLRPIGFQLFEAQDGEEGLTLARQLLPDVLISDLVMPKMGGWKLVELLRGDDATQELIVIASSASVVNDEAQLAVENGFDLFLPKPVDGERLLREIGRMLQLTYRYAEQETSDDALMLPPPAVLDNLRRAAKRGDIRALRQQVAALDTADGSFAPFVQQVMQHINGFEIGALRAWLAEQGQPT